MKTYSSPALQPQGSAVVTTLGPDTGITVEALNRYTKP
jgi:hypothetical protein